MLENKTLSPESLDAYLVHLWPGKREEFTVEEWNNISDRLEAIVIFLSFFHNDDYSLIYMYAAAQARARADFEDQTIT